jgi:sec-independent protein translocase protein TatC
MAGAEELRRRRLRFLRSRRRKRTESAMSMVEHLSELRGRIIVSAAAFAVISAVAFFLFNPILDFLLNPLCAMPKHLLGPSGCRLNFFGVVEPFMVRFKVAAMVGIVASSPVWLYEVWAFVVPGLTDRERNYALPFVTTSIFLFLVGASFAYLTLPYGLKFLIGIGGHNLIPLLKADSYLNFVGLMIMIFGVTFELPLVLFFLGLARVVSVEQLRHQRRMAIVLIFVLAAVVTPSQDPYTMTIMAVPLYLLYELTIVLLRIVLRRREAREAS